MVDDLPAIHGAISPGPGGLVSLHVAAAVELIADPTDPVDVAFVVADPGGLGDSPLATLAARVASGESPAEAELLARLVLAGALYGLDVPGVPLWFGHLLWADRLAALPDALRDALDVDPPLAAVLAVLRSDPTGEPLPRPVRAAALALIERLTERTSPAETCWVRAWREAAAPAPAPAIDDATAIARELEGRERALELALHALMWEAAGLREHARVAWEEVAACWQAARRPAPARRAQLRAEATSKRRARLRAIDGGGLRLRPREAMTAIAAGSPLTALRRPLVVEVLGDEDAPIASLRLTLIQDEVLVEHKEGLPVIVKASGEPLRELAIPLAEIWHEGSLSLQELESRFRPG